MSSITINNQPNVEELWAGIGGHFDSLGQIINEFIDNSISNFIGCNTDFRNVEISLLEETKGVLVSIEDSGTGLKDLDKAFTLGGRGGADSPLNEHGFGLKHAMASANPNNDNWVIFTRTDEDVANNRFKRIKAPYALQDFTAEVVGDENWPGRLNGTGTLIQFMCSKQMFWTLGRGFKGGIRDFKKLADILCEDIGFIYSSIIKQNKASITLRITTGLGETTSRGIGAVEPDWKNFFPPNSGSETKDLGNGNVLISYQFGRIKDKPSREGHPFDNNTTYKYYKTSTSSSGVEIRINGRVLTNNLFKEIWGLEKHNSYNDLLIIIDVQSKDANSLPKTRTSKNGMREGDARLEELYSWIRAKYPTPVKETSLSDHETDLFEQLKNNMLTYNDDPNKVIDTEKHVFTSTGNSRDKVRIDLYKNSMGKISIYEGKKDCTSSQDVYQLRMYWDGLVYDGIKPDIGYLVASYHPDSVKNLIAIVNTMKDCNENNYHFEVKTWKDEGLNYSYGNL